MNEALDRLAKSIDLDAPVSERLRLAFGYACVRRVEHLVEEPGVLVCLRSLGGFLEGNVSREKFAEHVAEAARLANQHQGSKSIDGVGHAAVSATYAIANALAGKARQAAEYAAYATVYGQGGYGAVKELESFQPEFEWQVHTLSSLAGELAGSGKGMVFP